MTKVQKTDNVQANYNAQNNKKVKKQEAGKKAVFNKAKKSANTFTDKSGKTYEILGVVKGSKRGHLEVKDIKTGKHAFASANHVILKESYVTACLIFDNEKTKKVTAKNNGKSYVVLKENVDRLGRKLVMNRAGQQFYMAKDNTVIKADYAQGTAYVENVKHKIRTTKNAKEKARLEKELDSRASYSDKNIIRIKGDNNKFWYIDKRTGRAVNLTQKEADAIIKDLDNAAGGFLGTGIGTKDSKLLRTNQSIVDPAVLNRIDKHYAQDKSFQKDVKNGKYKSHYEAFLGSEISKDEVYKFDADLVKQGAIVDQKRRNEILLTNLTTYGKKFDNRHSALDAVTTKEDYNYLQKGAARFNKANNVKAGKGETALESLIAFQTEDDANLIDLSFKKLFAPEKNELTTQAEKTGINLRTNVKLILSGVDENIDTALDSHDSEMYAQMDKLLPANKKLATLNKKSDLMMAGYGKFSNEDLANEAVRLLNEAKSLSSRYASSGENVNSVYALKGAIKSSSSDYQHKSDTNLAKVYGIIKNPEVLALVEKKCPWFKSVVVDKKFPKNYTTEDYLFYNRVTNNKIADFANIALESSKVDPKLKKEDIEANKEQIKELKAIFNSLRNEHSFDVNGENEKMKLISRMRSATLLGQIKEDTRDTYRVAQSVLQKLELAAEGKLVDKNGKHIPFEQAVKKYTGMNLAEVNQKYLQHQQYGEIAADLTIGMATAPLGVGVLKGAGTFFEWKKMLTLAASAEKLAKGTNLTSKLARASLTGAGMGAGQYVADTNVNNSTFESRALKEEKAAMVAEFGGAGSLVGEISGGIASNMTSKAKALGVHTVGAGADVAIGGAIMEMNGQSYKDFLKDPLAMGMMAFAHVSSARASMAKFSPANKAKTLMAMHKQGEAVKDLPTMNAEQRASFEKLNLPEAKTFLKESGIQYTEVKGGIEFTDANGAHRVQYDKTGAFQQTKTQKLGISSKEVEDLVTYAEKGHANAEQVKAELGSKLTPEQTARLDKTIAKNQPAVQNQPAQQKSEVETIREELQNVKTLDELRATQKKITQLPKGAERQELFESTFEIRQRIEAQNRAENKVVYKDQANDVNFDSANTQASADAMQNRNKYVPDNSTAPNKKGRVREWLNKKFSIKNTYNQVIDRLRPNKSAKLAETEEIVKQLDIKPSQEGSTFEFDGYSLSEEVNGKEVKYYRLTEDADGTLKLFNSYEYKFDNEGNTVQAIGRDANGNIVEYQYMYNGNNVKTDADGNIIYSTERVSHDNQTYTILKDDPIKRETISIGNDTYVIFERDGKTIFTKQNEGIIEKPEWFDTVANKASSSEELLKTLKEKVSATENETPVAPAENEISVGGDKVAEPVVAGQTVEIPKPISERLGIKFNGRGSRIDNITSEKATKTSKPQKIEIDGETYTLEQQYTSGRFGRNKKVAVETIKDGDRIVEQRVFNENGQPELVVRNNENGSQTQIEYKDGVETQITTTTAEGDHFFGFDDAYKPNAEIGKCLQEGGISLTDGTQAYYDALGNEYNHATIKNADGTTAQQWQIRDKKTGNFVEYKPEEHAITPHGVKAQSSFSVKATFNKVIDRLRPNKSAKQAETGTLAILDEGTSAKHTDAKAEEIVKQLDIKPSQEGSTFEVSGDYLNEKVNGKEVKYYGLMKDADGTLKVSYSNEYKFDNEGNKVQTISRDANGNVDYYQYGDYKNSVRTDADSNIISSVESVSHDNQTYTITKNNSNKIEKIDIGDDCYYITEQDGKTTFNKQHWDGKDWSKGEVTEKPEWWDTVANKASSPEELLKTLKEKVTATENETPVVKPVEEEASAINLNEEPVSKPEGAKQVENEGVAQKSNETPAATDKEVTPADEAGNPKPTGEKAPVSEENNAPANETPAATDNKVTDKSNNKPSQYADKATEETVNKLGIKPSQKGSTFEYKDGRLHEVVDGKEVRLYFLEKDASGNPTKVTDSYETTYDKNGEVIEQVIKKGDKVVRTDYNLKNKTIKTDENGDVITSTENITHDNQQYSIKKDKSDKITRIEVGDDVYHIEEKDGITTFTNEHRGSDGKYSEPKPVDKPEWYDSVAGKASKQKDLLKQAQKEVKADGVGQKSSGSRLKKVVAVAALGGLAYGGKLVYDSYKEKSEAVTPVAPVDPAEDAEQEEPVENPAEDPADDPVDNPADDPDTPDADNQSSEVADNDTNNNGSSSASDENNSSVDDSNNSSNTDNSAPADDTNRSREAESNDTDNNKVEDKKTEKKEKVTTPSEDNGVKNDETQNGEHGVTIAENLEKLDKMTSDIHTVEDFNNFVERLKLERENENITDDEMAELIAKAKTNMEPETTPVQEVNDETTTDTTSEEKVEDVVNNDKPVQTPTTKGKQEITPDVRMSLVEDIQNAKEVSDIREIQRKIRQYKRFPGRKNLRRAYKAKLREIRHQDKAAAKAQKYEAKFNERMDKIMSSDIYKNDQNQLNLKKSKGNSIFG